MTFLRACPVVAKEDAERKRVEGELNELKRALASSKAKCGAVETEIEQKRAHIDMLRAGMPARFSSFLPRCWLAGVAD